MRFGLFFLADSAHMITSCAVFPLVFLGGYHLPFVSWLSPESTSILAVVAKFGVFYGKVVLLICFMMVIRWTLPRLRYDQVMMMAWQAVIPLSLVVLVLTSVMVYFDLRSVVPMLGANAVLFGIFLGIQHKLHTYDPNRRIQLYGSRFRPMPGEKVVTGPTHPIALEDRPVQGTVPNM